MTVPVFKYVEDAVRYIEELKLKINDLVGVIEVRNTVLAKVKPVRVTSRSLVGLGKASVPTLKSLNADFATLQELNSIYNALEFTEYQVRSQFADARDLNRLLDTIALYKLDVENSISLALNFLSNLANGYVPLAFKERCGALLELLKANTVCNSFKDLYFLHLNKDLVFTYYVVLYGVKNAEGVEIPEVFIALQWVLDSNSGVYKVCVTPHMVLPNELAESSAGTIVTTPLSIVHTVRNMLMDEGIDSNLGVLPIVANVFDRVLNFRDFVASSRLKGNSIVVSIKDAKANAGGVGVELHNVLASALNVSSKEIIVNKVNKGLSFSYPLIANATLNKQVKEAFKLKGV